MFRNSFFKFGAQFFQSCALVQAEGKNLFYSGIPQKSAGAIRVGPGGVAFGNHADDPSVEHGRKGRRELAGGAGGILNEKKHVAIRFPETRWAC